MTRPPRKKLLLLALVLAMLPLTAPSASAVPSCTDIATLDDTTGGYVGEMLEVTVRLAGDACSQFAYPLFVYTKPSGDPILAGTAPTLISGDKLTYSVNVGMHASVCIQNRVTNNNGTVIFDLAPHRDEEPLPVDLSSACLEVTQGGIPDPGPARSYS